MSFGKNKSSSTQQSTSVEELDPDIKAALLGNYQSVQQFAANNPYTPYTGQRVADPSQSTKQAWGRFGDIASQETGRDALTGAMTGAQAAQGFQPSQIRPVSATAGQAQTYTGTAAQAGPATMAATGSPVAWEGAGDAAKAAAAVADRTKIRDVNGGLLSDIDLSGYTNPYQDQVTANTLADINHAREVALNQSRARSSAARSFGGAGDILAQTGIDQAFAKQTADTSASLRSAGYDRATSLAMADLDRRFAAAQANQGVDQNVVGLNAGYQQQTNLANQAAANDMARFDATGKAAADQFNSGQQQQVNLTNAAAANTRSEYDAANRQQMEAANIAAQNAGSQFNAGNRQQANLANAAAENAAQVANQSAGLTANQQRLAASGLLGDLSNQELSQAVTRAGLLAQAGDQQTAYQQSLLDADYAKAQAPLNYQIMIQQLLNQTLGLAGNPTLTDASSTGTSKASGFNFDSGLKFSIPL